MQAITKAGELPQEAAIPEPSTPPTSAGLPSDWHDRVQQRAYELSRQREDSDGDALRDWYQAEAELRAALGPS